MKGYVENMKEYVKNMKEYVKNMKKYVENVESMKEYIGNMKKYVDIGIRFRTVHIGSGTRKNSELPPLYGARDLGKLRALPLYMGLGT